MKIAKLLQVENEPRLKNRTIVYLTVALIVQVFFWYFGMPGPQLAADYQPTLDNAAWTCLISAACLLVIPFSCLVLFRDQLTRFGFGFGDFKYGLLSVAIVGPIFVIATCLGSGDSQLAAFYPLPGETIGEDRSTFLLWLLCYACFYVSFEFFYRGFLLFGPDDLGLTTCFVIQLGCCVLIHAGKPLSETLASIPAAIVFAWITIRTGSFIYAFLIHFAVGVANDLAILFQQNQLHLFEQVG